MPVKLFQDGTNAKFKARVSIEPKFAIVDSGSETPLVRIAPGVQVVFLQIQVNEPDGKTVMEVVKQSCRVATDSAGNPLAGADEVLDGARGFQGGRAVAGSLSPAPVGGRGVGGMSFRFSLSTSRSPMRRHFWPQRLRDAEGL